MTLQWSTVAIPLGTSMDESQTPFALPNPLLQKLQNARVFKGGSVGKRPGWAPQATTIPRERLIAVNDEIFSFAGRQTAGTLKPAIDLGSVNALYQRIDYHGGSKGAYSISEVEVLERAPVVRDITNDSGTSGQTSSNPDVAVSEQTAIAVMAWEVGLPLTALTAKQRVIFAVAVDMVTREPVSGPLQISTGSGDNISPICILSTATTITVVYGRTTGNELRAVVFNCSTRTWGADTVIANNLHSVTRFDAAEVVGGSGWYVIYRNVTPVVQITYFTGLTATATGTLGEDNDTGPLSVYPDGANDRVWCGWYSSANGVRGAVRQLTVPSTVVLAPTTLDPVAGDPARQMTWSPVNATTNILTWNTQGQFTATDLARKILRFRTLTTTGTLGITRQTLDLELIGKAYAAPNGFTYVPVLYDASDASDTTVTSVQARRSDANQVAFTLMLTDTPTAANAENLQCFRVAATWAVGEAGRKRSISSLSSFRSVLVDASNNIREQWFMLAPEFDSVLTHPSSVQGGQICGRPGVDLCRQRIDNYPPLFATRIGGAVVFSGGTPQVWDGSSLTEYGFLCPPENGLGSDDAASADAPGLTAGNYVVQLVWEYRQANGDIVQSVPSQVRSALNVFPITITATHGIKILVPALNNTRKWLNDTAGKGVVLRAYRSEANGQVYYRDGEMATSSGFVANTPRLATAPLTLRVGQPDSIAVVHPKLYTTDGILPNFPPPSLCYVHTHRNRLFGIVAENRKQVVFTHVYEVGELPGWHPDLVIDVPDEAVALATIDEKLVILCRDGIYMIAGNGPDRKGLNSDYDQPFRLNSPHGCASAESVVNVPAGIAYLSPTGFCLMNRKTEITRIGGPVEDTVATYPYCHAATVLDDQQWIYWSMTDHPRVMQSTGGCVVVFDWGFNVWSVDFIASGAQFVTSFARSGEDLYCTIGTDTNMYLHRGAADPGAEWIYTYLKTARLNLGSNQYYQRARWLTLLGERRDTHELNVTVRTFHHATSVPQTQLFQWTDAQLTATLNYALKMHLRHQKGALFEIEIADGPDASAPSAATDSATWVGLQLEIGAKRRTHQVAQAATE